MRLVVFGGDERMEGAVRRAKGEGWDVRHIRREVDASEGKCDADAALLPWPHSFCEEKLKGSTLSKARVLTMISACRLIVYGSGVDPAEMPQAARCLNPGADEMFLRENAQLTAEGAVARAMQRPDCAILGSTAMITGFGRIGQELAARLVALGAFVIVCARSEAQMRRAHEMGAHPVPLAQAVSACRQSDTIFNTVPAHVLGKQALEKIRRDALVIELASPPYGMNIELARHMGVNVVVESGLPGRYAPRNAGAALLGALQREMEGMKGVDGMESAGKKGDSHG